MDRRRAVARQAVAVEQIAEQIAGVFAALERIERRLAALEAQMAPRAEAPKKRAA